jgi:hypothetical protein
MYEESTDEDEAAGGTDDWGMIRAIRGKGEREEWRKGRAEGRQEEEIVKEGGEEKEDRETKLCRKGEIRGRRREEIVKEGGER